MSSTSSSPSINSSPLPNIKAFIKGSTFERKKHSNIGSGSNSIGLISAIKHIQPSTPLKLKSYSKINKLNTNIGINGSNRLNTIMKSNSTGCSNNNNSNNNNISTTNDLNSSFTSINSDIIDTTTFYNLNFKDNYLLNNYKLIGIINSGNYGVIYKICNIKTNIIYALKRLKENPINISFTQFYNSLLLYNNISLQNNNNNYICKFIDFWTETSGFYILLDYCKYGNLSYYMAKTVFKESDIWLIIASLIKSLNLLATNFIIHGDIKPENIFIDDNGIKLGDFGSCRLQSQSWDVGTGAYAAPEILNPVSLLAPSLLNENLLTPNFVTLPSDSEFDLNENENKELIEFTDCSDLFSLGVVILEMAADVDIPIRGDGFLSLRSDFSIDSINSDVFNERSLELKNLIKDLLKPSDTRINLNAINQSPQIIEASRALELFSLNLFSFIFDEIQLSALPSFFNEKSNISKKSFLDDFIDEDETNVARKLFEMDIE